MGKINTVYICNHSHTDIGFTDYQDICFRQHDEYFDQALNLIEATANYPNEAQYRWTCETTGPLLHYLRKASSKQVGRFLKWHEKGKIDIAGMQYNFTPLLNIEQLHRSLYPLKQIRAEFGFTVEAAMQDDVNGVSWLFADLLAEVGIKFYTAAVNPIRGARPKPFPGAFWWEGPSGKKVLAWNGYHYLFGRSQAGLGSWTFVERLLPRWVKQLEDDKTYPYDFLYCESTHPVRVDNGPPDPRMPEFVKKWNAEGRTPKLHFIAVTEFGRMMHKKYGKSLGVQRGDWTDHWTDGPGSSAFETGINRATHEILLAGEAIEAWLKANRKSTWNAERMAHVYEQATLYDEHTWGAYSSIEAPHSLFTKAHWSKKSNYAYTAAMEAHDMLARAANTLASTNSTPGIEETFNLGDLKPEEAFPDSGIDELMVINTLPWDRNVIVEEPEARGGAAPAGMLDTFFNRGSGWGGARPITLMRRVAGTIPAYGYAFVPLKAQPNADDLKIGNNTVENAFYRVRVDTKTGAVAEFYDKELKHDFAGSYQNLGIGQYLYEEVDSDKGRLAIANIDFAHPDFFVGEKNTPWVRTTATSVKVSKPKIAHGQAFIEVMITARGIESATCKISLDSRTKALAIDWKLNKLHHPDPEAVFIAFPFNLKKPNFKLDLNGIPSTPNDDQLDGAAKDWYPVQRWVDVSDDSKGVTLVPIDAPLVHLGGITTGKWARTLKPESSTIMSWAINNHWLVNFKLTQGGEIPFRYRLTTHKGSVDESEAARFGAETLTPPIVLRDRKPTGARQEQFLKLSNADNVLLTAKPADDGKGIILRLQNLKANDAKVGLEFTSTTPRSACLTSPIEVNGKQLPIKGKTVQVPLKGLAVQSLRIEI